MSPRLTLITEPAQRRLLAQRGAGYLAMSGPAEFIGAITMFALLVGFAMLNVIRQNFDSDEPQHLHVIYSPQLDRLRL